MCLFSTGNQGNAAQWELKKGLRVLAIGGGHVCVCVLADGRLSHIWARLQVAAIDANLLACWHGKINTATWSTNLALYWADKDPHMNCFVKFNLDILETKKFAKGQYVHIEPLFGSQIITWCSSWNLIVNLFPWLTVSTVLRMKIENGLPCSQLPEAPPQTGLQFTVATEEDFDDIMAMSKDIYGGLDYLPSRYQAWLQESNRTVILARKQGKVVRKWIWRDFLQCLFHPHSFKGIVHPKWT